MNSEILIGTIGTIFFIAGALALNVYTIYYLAKTIQAKYWERSEGEITGVHLKVEETSEGPHAYTEIRYRYNVNGSYFISNRIGYGYQEWSESFWAENAFLEILKTYPKVTAYVNPKNPGEATLVVGIRRFHLVQVIFAVFFNMFVIYIALSEFAKNSITYSSIIEEIVKN